MHQINWGIIGCGDVTEMKSGPAFSKVPGSSLVAVMRRDAAKAEDYARRHHVTRWYTDAAQLIADPEVNAVYIATPPDSHEAYTIAAIHAGKPVYVEKPMCLDRAGAMRMAAAAAAKNIKFTVAHYRRQQPMFKKIRQLLSEHAIGQPLLVRLELFRPPLTADELTDKRNAWRVDPAVSGGGLFHDLAPHQLDLMYHFFGPVQKVTGVAMNQGRQYQADDLVSGNIIFENGTAFTGTWWFNAPFAKDVCEITGTNGSIRFSIFGNYSIELTVDGKTTILDFEPLQHVQEPMIGAVVKYFSGDAENPCSGEEGAEVMKIMDLLAHHN